MITRIVCVCGVLIVALLSFAAVLQGQQSDSILTAKLDSITARVQASSVAPAEKAAKAAKAVLGAATSARSAATKLQTVRGDATKTLAELLAAGDTAAKAAKALVALSDSAVDAAAAAEAVVKSDVAKAKAAEAVAGALRKAREVDAASSAATKAGERLAPLTDLAKARNVADTVASETIKAATAAGDLTLLVAAVAEESASPSLPVIVGTDNNVIEALRIRLTAGSIFFNGAPRVVKTSATSASIESSQFGQAAVYLALESQPRLFEWSCWYKYGKPADAEKCHSRAKARSYERFYIDPSVGIRLTTIPVSGNQVASSAGTTQSPDQAIQSQKAAQVVFGLITSWNFGAFDVNNSKFHWGFGPVARGFFQSVTDAQRATRVWNPDDDLYGSSAAGLRLTLYERDRHVGDVAQHGWAPAAYVDASWGTFQNFEKAEGKTAEGKACLANVSACLAGGLPPDTAFTKTNPARVYIEGRVFLQFLYLGFELNNGPGPDDLRFIGGLTMKFDQFFTRR